MSFEFENLGNEKRQKELASLLGNGLQVSLVADAIFAKVNLLLALRQAVRVRLTLFRCLDSCKYKNSWSIQHLKLNKYILYMYNLRTNHEKRTCGYILHLKFKAKIVDLVTLHRNMAFH